MVKADDLALNSMSCENFVFIFLLFLSFLVEFFSVFIESLGLNCCFCGLVWLIEILNVRFWAVQKCEDAGFGYDCINVF